MPSRTELPLTRPSRRDLLRAAGAAAIGAARAPRISAASLPYPSSGPLRVGLVGCGGRGTGAAANALRADPNVTLVALGDTFSDQLESSLATLLAAPDLAPKIAVDPEHRFIGFDAYRSVIDASDVVLLATPPHFRPRHLAAAVEAGRHAFVEKPVAVDVPGVRSVMASVERAREKCLTVVSGLCYRYDPAVGETIARVQAGAIGKVVALQATYHTGALWHRGRDPSWSDMEWHIRNWLYLTWLSGDHVVEQHVHSLDKVAWVLGDVPPARCTSSGGRTVRTGEEWGNVYDHFSSVFEWDTGVRAFSSCRQWPGAATDVSDHVLGTRGIAHLREHAIEAGPWTWHHESDESGVVDQAELDALFASVRSGEPRNDGAYMAQSTLMAIMARMSAYTGESLTWEQLLASELDLSPPSYEWGPLAVAPVARPGVTKFS